MDVNLLFIGLIAIGLFAGMLLHAMLKWVEK